MSPPSVPSAGVEPSDSIITVDTVTMTPSSTIFGRPAPARRFSVWLPPAWAETGVLLMSPDNNPSDEFSDGAYIARQSWRSNLPILVALSAVDIFLLYQAIRNPGPGIVFAPAGFGAATGFFAVLITRSVRRGEVSFAVDAGGVYFGTTGEGVQPELIPWSWIDCIVTFDRIVHSGGSQKGRDHYVGVELNATGIKGLADRRPWPSDAPPLTPEVQEFTEAALMPWLPHMLGEPSLVSRRIGGWRLDARSLAEAVMRYAPDTPIVRRPTRRDPGIAGIAGIAWQVRKNLQRRAERDDQKNDDDQ